MSINTVGIVGSGIMAGGLTEVVARGGHQVIVRARKQAGAEATVADIAANLDKQVSRDKLGTDERDATLARISATDSLDALAGCDLVIENVVEDLDIKRGLFAELGAIVQPSAILATNTSTLPVVDLAVASGRPDRVVGLHFFNPAPAMKLVELVAPLTADPAVVDAASEWAAALGKDVVPVADRAGFVVNALLFPYLNNAIRMWEAGTASMDGIDTAMRGGCGFPMGPFALLDLVGLDTSLSILEALYAEFGDANYNAAPSLRRKVAAGHLGRKTGRGFYTY